MVHQSIHPQEEHRPANAERERERTDSELQHRRSRSLQLAARYLSSRYMASSLIAYTSESIGRGVIHAQRRNRLCTHPRHADTLRLESTLICEQRSRGKRGAGRVPFFSSECRCCIVDFSSEPRRDLDESAAAGPSAAGGLTIATTDAIDILRPDGFDLAGASALGVTSADE